MWLTTISASLLVVLFVTWFMEYIKRWRMPPGPFPWPIIGNLPMFAGKSHLTFIDLAKKYGDVFSLKQGMTDVVVLNSVDAVREALVEKSVQFAGRPHLQSLDIRTEGRRNMAFADYSPAWKQHRKLVKSALREYASDTKLETKAHEALRDIIDELAKVEGQAVDLNVHIFNLVYNVVCPVVFGVRFRMEDEDFQNLMKFSDDLLKKDPPLGDIYPSIGFLPNRAKTDLQKLMEPFLGYCKRQVEQHRMDFNPDNLRDVTDHMIKAQKEAEEDGAHDITALTDTHLRQIVADVFLGGTETTTQVLRWAILYLAAHLEIQEKVTAELDRVVGRDRLPELSDRQNTPYTEATVNEVLRMGLIDPLSLPHATTVDTSLRGYHIPKGTVVLPNLWALHHDPAIWGDPHTFRPERFLDETGKLIPKPFALMPFSVGRRACPGDKMGMADTYLLLGGLVQNFHFSFPKGERPTDFSSDETGGGNVCQPAPYKVVLTYRK
ncbi:steroid 17-alpha-hydroxylase/17,20 lyase-like [Branchiostoma floridae]|uniref:Steroid 21-hydroxylase n=1 Tax=Branchiostoma floridae TaxID=7739 RepID=A0A9J7N121_BRAFL|nr:steroid 17-alpha-hydroxylase/17,20 lyase-like [Branchiostoma floridae]XP_035687442.1 steroid 17-alpha-hydroxylase/17,20 lyase-like [Branchiostoma floridae]